MEFTALEVVKGQAFVIKALHNQRIPGMSPSAVADAVIAIRHDCGFNPSGIRFFWPEADTATEMLAVMPDVLKLLRDDAIEQS
jgi:hypothetical protein